MDGNVIHCDFNAKTIDGGKARMRRGRELRVNGAVIGHVTSVVLGDCGLTQMRADPEMPCDVAYSAPASDPA